MFVLFNLALGAFLLGGGSIFILEVLSDKKEKASQKEQLTSSTTDLTRSITKLLEEERTTRLSKEIVG